MAADSSKSGVANALSESEIKTKFAQLKDAIPDPWKYSPILPVILDKAECRNLILPVLTKGITDVWLPLSPNNISEIFDPGPHLRFRKKQKYFLSDSVVHDGSRVDQHFNLSGSHLASNYRNPTTGPNGLRVVRNLGDGGFGFVEEVEDTLSRSKFALKRIQRKTNFKELEEQMRYITMELMVLRKIRNQSPHYVSLVCSYTDMEYVGILMEPVADSDLGDFLDGFSKTDGHKKSLLAGFFACLATALAKLHLVHHIRHKDIKPSNILVKGQNVLFTDFGLALDWSATGHTTTKKPGATEKNLVSRLCFLGIPAVLKGMPRSEVEQILKNNGTSSVNYRQNEPGIVEVIERLEQKDDAKCGNAPLEWIKRMLKRDKEDRPNALELRAMIFDSKNCGLPLWGGCCRDAHLFQVIDASRLGTQPTRTISRLDGQFEEVLLWPNDDAQVIRELLDKAFSIKDQQSWRGLHWAVKTGNANAVCFLLKNGIDTSITTEDGTLAHIAAVGDYVDVLQLLKDNGVDLHERHDGTEGWTPLHGAVKNSCENAVEFLLKNGADPQKKTEKGWTALHSAAEKRSWKIAKLLLGYGAKISEKNDNGTTPLHKSAFSGSESVAELLLEHGADVNERDADVRTALHAAAMTKVIGVAKVLLSHGADVDTKDKKGNTPLHWAAGTGNTELTRLLLDRGANINQTTDGNNCTPLWLASRNNHPAVVQLLVGREAKVDIANYHGFTPLLLAAGSGDYEIVELLLEKADVGLKAHDGKTALHMAVIDNEAEVAKLLLDKGGAKTESRDEDNWTPLH